MSRSQFFYFLAALLLLITTNKLILTSNALDDEADVEVDESDSLGDGQVDNSIEYRSPVLTDPQTVYLSEDFDDPDKVRSRWISSKAKKEDQEGSKYDGVWDYQLPQRPIFPNDRSLVLKTKAKHAAISAKLNKPYYFKTKPLFVQYEVTFQNGMDCGGAYIKLLSHSSNLDLSKFTDKTPYSIMFGPDKCGNDYKLHFIFRHKNPINGSFEEKHAKKPTNRLEEVYTDKKPHAYLLKLYPDNTFQIYVDNQMVNSGSLLSDMSPPINPPMEIPDAEDKKPFDWDERENIPDETATKPDDWDEEAPAKIPDPLANVPDGWLLDETPMIPDTTAKKPEDWDESMDGDWEPPLITNPACEGAPGCGEWTAPLIDNPNFRGKWKQPMIPNPNYKGKWSPRLIPNPDYFEDKEPFKMTPIGALGIEIWTMTDMVLFDNFLITDNEAELLEWTRQTYSLKKSAIDKDSEGVISRTLKYTNAHPWLWAVYVVVIGLPLVLIVTFCCGSQDKKHESNAKKTDEYVEDDQEEGEEDTVSSTTTLSPTASTSGKGKKPVPKGKQNPPPPVDADVEEELVSPPEKSSRESTPASGEDESDQSGDGQLHEAPAEGVKKRRARLEK